MKNTKKRKNPSISILKTHSSIYSGHLIGKSASTFAELEVRLKNTAKKKFYFFWSDLYTTHTFLVDYTPLWYTQTVHTYTNCILFYFSKKYVLFIILYIHMYLLFKYEIK